MMQCEEMSLVKKEMEKNPELKESDIQMLKEWCNEQPHLPKVSDRELIMFLHSNYYKIEPTKSTIEAYYTIRSNAPEFFGNRDPLGSKELRKAFNVSSFLPLEQTTSDGCRVIYARILDTEPSNYVYEDNIKFSNMILDLELYIQGSMNGIIIVSDVTGVTFGHATRASLSSMRKNMHYVQEALPVRLKALHVINTNSVMDLFLSITKPFMKKEIMGLIHLHSTMESFSKFLPIEMLPNEAGGKAGPLMDLHNAYIKKLESYRDWFLEEEIRTKVDESKRPAKPRSIFNIFGSSGKS